MSKTIYLTILIMVIAIFVALPVIFVPISSSSRGVIRSVRENTQLTAVISGRVTKTQLEKNNQNIKKGDTLLVVTTEQLDTQKNLQTNQSADYLSNKFLRKFISSCCFSISEFLAFNSS